MKRTIKLPFGELVELRDMFKHPENADTLDDPRIVADFGKDGIIETVYNEIRSFWCAYENRHGRHVYDFDAIVIPQIINF